MTLKLNSATKAKAKGAGVQHNFLGSLQTGWGIVLSVLPHLYSTYLKERLLQGSLLNTKHNVNCLENFTL